MFIACRIDFTLQNSMYTARMEFPRYRNGCSVLISVVTWFQNSRFNPCFIDLWDKKSLFSPDFDGSMG